MFREFTPEEELLICCARTRLEPQTAVRITEILDGAVDWNRLMLLARHHCLSPLVYLHLRERIQNVAPAAFRRELERDFGAHADHNRYLAHELLRLFPLLETKGIPIIAFKGPEFAENVYKNLTLRTFMDLDFLLREQDLARATEVLSSAGYVQRHSGSRVRDTLAFRRGSELEFVSVAHRFLMLDVHLDLLPPQDVCKLDVADVFRHARLTQLFDHSVCTLSPEDLLLFSCVHATRHMQMFLYWLTDVAEIVRAFPQIDWEALVETAHHAHCTRMLGVSLLAAADLLNAPVPAHVLARVKSDAAVEKLVEQVKWRLFDETETSLRTHALRKIAMKERLTDKLKVFLWFALWPSEYDYDVVRLPPQLMGLYFAIHPVVLALTIPHTQYANARRQCWRRRLS